MQRTRDDGRITLQIDDSREPSLSLRFMQIPEFDDDWREILQMPNPTGTWAEIVATSRFVQNSSKESLAAELATLAKQESLKADEQHRWWSFFSPWPLALCLKAANSGQDLCELSDAAIKGQFGDYTDWIAVQENWISKGVSLSDLEEVVQLDSAGLRIEAKWIEFCHTLHQADGTRGEPATDLQRVIELYEKHPTAKQHKALGAMIAAGLCDMSGGRGHKHDMLEICPRPESIKSWFVNSGRHSIPPHLEELIPLPVPLTQDWLEVLDIVGSNTQSVMRRARFRRMEEEPNTRFLSNLIKGYIDDPSRKGLLRWITRRLPREECDQRIPKELLWPADGENTSSCIDMLFLLLFWGDLSTDDARNTSKIAKELCYTNLFRWSDVPRLRFMFRHWDESWAMEFVLNVIEDLPVKNEQLREGCHDWLAYHLSRRPSPLQDFESAQKMGLGKLT